MATIVKVSYEAIADRFQLTEHDIKIVNMYANNYTKVVDLHVTGEGLPFGHVAVTYERCSSGLILLKDIKSVK